MKVLAELKNRGVTDVCFVCCDGLSGLPEAITTVWPAAIVQTCIVHLIRASMRYSSKKHITQVTAALRPIYQAPTLRLRSRGARRAGVGRGWPPLPCDPADLACRVGRGHPVSRVSPGNPGGFSTRRT
ncbi:hypothetical protein GCM10017788_61740 [Amycolatopsis acidiphila]|uniref:Mutator family transposase n=1 Tax=Amycolatopsis acidiphila TaxID=715473 RepID=A0A558AIF7_9PSEU|nr:hypothetical protein FNH06_07500 [Amycolatopsis acidiphila]GHG87790.1 hypothetical protein GCM10017788_61740 [Amycolatopsis acidiphila]